MQTHRSDRDLLKSLKSNSRQLENEALQAIYVQVYPKVERFVSKSGGSSEESYDVFQDAILIFFKHVTEGRFREESSISTYIQVICRNLWYEQIRKSRRMQAYRPDEEEAYEINEDDLLALKSTHSIEKLLKKLGDECQQVLKLFYFEKKRMTEIQSHFGLSSEQVAKNKKYKCLKKLTDLCNNMNLRKEDFSYE